MKRNAAMKLFPTLGAAYAGPQLPVMIQQEHL